VLLLEEETRGLAELKKELENRIAELEKELELLRGCLKVVDEALAKSSFKPAIELITQPTATAQQARATTPTPPKVGYEEEQEVQIRSKYGELLATMYVGKKHVRIVPAQDKKFSVKTPPFASFFLDRVLNEMRRKDEKSAERGEKYPEEVLKYDIKTVDGDAIAEIFIDNVLDENRIREIKSAVRWTFERMYEKTAGKRAY